MTTQNYKNHARLIPLWHYITVLALLALLGGSIFNLVNSSDGNRYSASLLMVIALLLIIFWVYIRVFALKAQDRAIRAEENFRHFILTGKPLDSRLHISQIIGLRFASDEEFPELSRRSAEENLSQKQIKQAIANWKGDFYRV